MKTNAAIYSYGSAIPRLRISSTEVARAWERPANAGAGLGVKEKAVPATDEDTITLAADSAREALTRMSYWRDDFQKELRAAIGAMHVGSESHPYAVKSSAAVVGQILGLGNNYTAADLEFACKAGTAALQLQAGLVGSGMITAGIAIGADTAQSRPGDALEYAAAAAGAALLVGPSASPWRGVKPLAQILHSTSFTSDTPDFWRREHQIYPSHAGRFTGEPAYFRHLGANVKQILAETDKKAEDFAHVIFHMPNARFPMAAAKSLGFSAAQMAAGFTVTDLGNSYSACSLVGLAAVLDVAQPGELILLCSYGSGSGSDAFVLQVEEGIADLRKKLGATHKTLAVSGKIGHKKAVDYSKYLRNLAKLRLA